MFGLSITVCIKTKCVTKFAVKYTKRLKWRIVESLMLLNDKEEKAILDRYNDDFFNDYSTDVTEPMTKFCKRCYKNSSIESL